MNLFSAWFKMNLGDAAVYALVGIMVVFAVLVILVAILYLFQFIFGKIEKGVGTKNKVATPVITDSDETDQETVAAIMAAITVLLEGEQEASEPVPFVIKKIKRIK